MINHKTNTGFLIIGAGIIGLTIALELKKQYPDASITIIEKEKQLAQHASGRNSGVLHAGFYYTADSLKARFTRDGNQLLTRYCLERKLSINRCGKLVVARNEQELTALYELEKRGKINGVELELMTDKEAKKIEPLAKTYQQALFSPTTSSVNPKEVMTALYQDIKLQGIQLHRDTQYISHKAGTVFTNKGRYSTDYVINAAGLYADTIAKKYGFAQEYTLLPFKGLYLYLKDSQIAPKMHIYPVPNLLNPFLGVHFTITADGTVKLGPTALPALWREQYKGLKNFNLKELFHTSYLQLKLLFYNSFSFHRLAWQETQKYFKPIMLKDAEGLTHKLAKLPHWHWGAAGIRAQLVNTRQGTLEMDFKYCGDKQSFHILNAVSPAFTCSMAFSKHIVQKITDLIN